MLISQQYKDSLTHYRRTDGIKAIILYGIYLILLFLQGFLFTTDIDAAILNASQIVFAMIFLLLVIIFIKGSKEKFNTIGLTKIRLFQSITIGILGAIIFIGVIALYNTLIGQLHMHLGIAPPFVIITFIFCAIPEELVFRGYIQTRLTGIVKNSMVCSFITAFLFLLIHYPVRWMATGDFSFGILPIFNVIYLLVLHFICDLVYRKTNCLWGAIILHIAYNIGTSMLIFT